MRTYLTAEELVVINQVVTQESGGSHGLRDPGLLESIALKPQAAFSGKDLYPDIFLKSAVLCEATTNYHVFIDGNKRTGFAAMARFLSVNGYQLVVTDKGIVAFSLNVARNKPDLADITTWIKKHTKKTKETP